MSTEKKSDIDPTGKVAYLAAEDAFHIAHANHTHLCNALLDVVGRDNSEQLLRVVREALASSAKEVHVRGTELAMAAAYHSNRVTKDAAVDTVKRFVEGIAAAATLKN